jgi:hypothetical protein
VEPGEPRGEVEDADAGDHQRKRLPHSLYTQGLASFAALQRRGIPSELLVFPDENHWVLKAKNSLQWHQNVFGWLARWLKPAQPVGK